MDIENGTLDYMLNGSIKVHFSEEGEKEVGLLVMSEPTRAHAKKGSKLKQMIMRCMMEVSKNTDTNQPIEQPAKEDKALHEKTNESMAKDVEEMKGALRIALLLSEKVDLGEFVETFIEMALKPGVKKHIIMCDGKVPIKDIHFDQMSEDEVEELAITYASFFHMPSVMQEQ